MGGGISSCQCDVVFGIMGVVDEYERGDPDRKTVENAAGSGGLGG